jgi:hypothetical protein
MSIGGRGTGARRHRAGGGRALGRRLVAVALTGAVAACSSAGNGSAATTTTGATSDAPVPVSAAPRAGYPTPSAAPSTTPLRSATARATPGAAHAFLKTQEGSVTPVAYDPCRPVRIVVNGRTAPPGADDLLAEALRDISAVSGFELQVEGPTTEEPTSGREPFQPAVYGDRWAPALVAWSDPAESPQLAGEVAGSGGSTPLELSAGGPMVYVTGMVVLDGPQVAGMLDGPGGRNEARAVVLHELGHLVGLGHVDDPTQLMHGDGREGVPGVTALGAGDLSGFAGLRAAATCVGRL